MTNKPRLITIDFIRGTAVIGMIIFHFFFILHYFGVFHQEIYKGIWLIIVRYVQYTFLGLVGISLALSYKNTQKHHKFFTNQIIRSIKIFFLAIIVTITTLITIKYDYVRFGILHLIATGVLLFSFLANRIIPNIIIGLTIIFLTPIIQKTQTDLSPLYIFGFNTGFTQSIDYFPIFPWIGIIALGVAFGNILLKKTSILTPTNTKRETNFLAKGIIILGKKSLLIYMIHVPIIFIILICLNVINFEFF